jgi:hypothetical protein
MSPVMSSYLLTALCYHCRVGESQTNPQLCEDWCAMPCPVPTNLLPCPGAFRFNHPPLIEGFRRLQCEGPTKPGADGVSGAGAAAGAREGAVSRRRCGRERVARGALRKRAGWRGAAQASGAAAHCASERGGGALRAEGVGVGVAARCARRERAPGASRVGAGVVVARGGWASASRRRGAWRNGGGRRVEEWRQPGVGEWRWAARGRAWGNGGGRRVEEWRQPGVGDGERGWRSGAGVAADWRRAAAARAGWRMRRRVGW